MKNNEDAKLQRTCDILGSYGSYYRQCKFANRHMVSREWIVFLTRVSINWRDGKFLIRGTTVAINVKRMHFMNPVLS